MTFPTGVAVRTVQLPVQYDSGGNVLQGQLLLEVSTSLKWSATAQLILSTVTTVDLVNGGASYDLPILQDGFVTADGYPISRWTYKATLRLPDGSTQVDSLTFALNYGVDAYVIDFATPDDVSGTVIEIPVTIQGAQGIAGPTGPSGTTGATGATGANGTNGTNGVGVPPAGTTNQILKKNSNSDYDTGWEDNAGGSVPTGGTTGQVLTKNSNTNGDAGWATPASVTPTFATALAGQVFYLVRASGGTGAWPSRPTNRTDLMFLWSGISPAPANGGTGMLGDDKWLDADPS